MFRNYFMPGFAVVMLAMFVAPRPARQDSGGPSQPTWSNLQQTPAGNPQKDHGSDNFPANGRLSRQQACKEAVDELNDKLAEYGVGRGDTPRAGIPDVEAMIALVPDPIHTHLALSFDRNIDTIQKALQDAPFAGASDWIYTSQWLPWDPIPYKAADKPADRKEIRNVDVGRQCAPGVLIFRRNDFMHSASKFLVMLLVGESPTGGVKQQQFVSAVSKWKTIENQDQDPIQKLSLRILGPNFSASLSTLSSLIEGNLCGNVPHPGCIKQVQVISGTVSADPQVVMSNFRGLKDANFFSLTENTGSADEMLLHYLSCAEHIRVGQIAFLSEDETAFGGFFFRRGQGCGNSQDKPLIVHFPREISQLRNAYQENGVLKTSATNRNTDSAKESLDLPLEDTHDQEDDVPSFSKNQNANSEEATLSAVTREMYERHIRAVVVNATDVLDTVFVTQFLKRNLPNARIVVSDADLIFAERGQARNFRGTLMVTPYPLIGNSADWGGRFLEGADGEGRGPYGAILPDRVFPSWDSIGTYNAVRLLNRGPLEITRDATNRVAYVKEKDGNPISLWLYGYVDPFRGGNGPPLWLSTVGRGGIWPIALLDPIRADPSVPQIFSRNTSTGECHLEGTIPHAMFKWEGRSRIAALFVLIPFVLAGALFCWSTNLDQRPQYMFGAAGTNSHRRAWIVLAIILCYSWISRLLILDLSWAIFNADIISWCMLAIDFFLFGFAIWLVKKALSTPWRLRVAAALLMLTAALQIGFHYVPSVEFVSRVFYFYRSAHLLDGVAPVLPYIFLFAALIAVVSRHIQALFYFSPALRPCLPGPEKTIEIARACDSPWRLPGTEVSPAGWESILAVACITGMAFWLCLGHGFDTMESNAYTFWLTVFTAIISFMLLYEIFWLYVIWSYLNKRLLIPLERTTLRNCFSRVSGFSWRGLWLTLDVQWQARYKALFRAYDSLCILKQYYRCPEDVRESAETVVKNYKAMFRSFTNPKRLLPRFRIYQNSLCACTEAVRGSNLLPPDDGAALSTGLDANGPERKKRLEQIAEKNPLRASAEEFVGLVYINFIQQVLVEIRTHVFAFAFGYFFLLLALDVYPVGPHHTIMLLLVCLFLTFFGVVAWMFRQMSKDSILSRTTETEPGKLDAAFIFHLASALSLPVLGLIASQFPEISNFLYSWLQPGLQAIK